MKYLVDANILSEPTRESPNLRVLAWLHENEPEIAIDPIILGEVRFGIYRLPNGSHKRRLEHWFVHVVEVAECLPWDSNIGLRWAKLLGDLRLKGKAMPIKDSMIAATALVYDLTVVTHNTADFRNSGVKFFDPTMPPQN